MIHKQSTIRCCLHLFLDTSSNILYLFTMIWLHLYVLKLDTFKRTQVICFHQLLPGKLSLPLSVLIYPECLQVKANEEAKILCMTTIGTIKLRGKDIEGTKVRYQDYKETFQKRLTLLWCRYL